MRILYLHPRSWSGEPMMLQVLADFGHEVCVLEERRGLGATRRLTNGYGHAHDGLRTYWYDPGRGLEKVLTWPADRVFKHGFEGRNLGHRMWIVHSAVRHFRPDVVFCGDGFSYAIPAALLKRLGMLRQPLVVSYIGGDILDCPEAEVGKERRGLTAWLIRASVRVPEVLRPVSPKIRACLLEEGADPARIRVIPSHLVRDPAELASLSAERATVSARVRARYGIAPQAPLIVTLGGNQKGKALHILAGAWPSILARLPAARWLLCGPDHPWLQESVLPMLSKQRASVITTGALAGDDVFEHLAAADLHVNPSLCESLNMATVEAAAVGTPTVSSDGAGISDWIRRLQCGDVVPRGEEVALADAILRALDSTPLRARWSEACRSLVPEFAPRTVAARLLECMTAAVH